ncbi:hypothetical protein GTO89_12460 [Heliobacterium gestii]|uniref:Uncharacterized protein n=1 Tax=Heliomicrobium gestii TaxID=2699 RepID=A0A845LGY4_HELGE|nr:hypothetical protein [Heliomicrobium gestii]MBM7867295.1 hypothetical protein [Heliomicrobium gestii]MZP43849.1 hypothetical protein [Heliomicrobium gestii]
MALCDKCRECRRDKEDELERFRKNYVDGGVVEKSPQCKDCDNVEGDDLERCLVCGSVIEKK